MSEVIAQAPSQKTREQRIEELLQIHYLRPEAKSPYDKLEIKDNEVFISVWRDLPPDPKAEKIECLGYQWLFAGRGQKLGEGASGVFREFSDLKTIHLKLVRVDYTLETNDGGHGKYERHAKVTPYLEMSVERGKVPKEGFSKDVFQNQTECLNVGRNLISKKEIKL
jgi:hypothetical protein